METKISAQHLISQEVSITWACPAVTQLSRCVFLKYNEYNSTNTFPTVL